VTAAELRKELLRATVAGPELLEPAQEAARRKRARR
jgi:hypothetical protein